MKKHPSLSLSCIVAATLLQSVFPSFADEFRGVWVDAFGAGFLKTSEVTKLVSDCRTYNFNAVVVQMRRRGDAFYIPQAPNTEPRTTAIAANYDALQDIINQCHNGTPRIEVHCWVASNLIWSDTANPPSQAAHVFNSHPEYLMKNSSGAMAISEGYYLDPGNPDAMTWNYNMARDIVSRYDIDGFHWDYIRYPAQDSGYNPTAIARYNAEFGLTGQPTPSSSQFSTWRRRQMTDFLRWVNADLLEVKPSLIVSASVFGNRSDATNFRFQEWGAWNSEGIIDICMPMEYTADNSLLQSRINDAFNNQGVRVVYPGIGAYLNTKENSVTQLNMIRNKPFKGSMFYSYRTPNSGTVNQATTLAYVRDNYQPTWTPTPVLPWVANPTNAIVKGNIRRLDNSAEVYNATVKISGPVTKTQKSEAHGKFAFYEVKPGNYNVSATSGGFSSATNTISLAAGQIYSVDLTIDLPVVTDTVAPLISAVNAGSITSNSCVVTWTTSENSDSSVEYGTTTGYGSTAVNGSMVLSHSVTINSLLPATTYNFRVKSKDAAGNESASDNFMFTTLAAQSEIILDNTNAVVVGSWSAASTSADKFGTDYRFKSKGTGAAYLEYRPTIAVGGNYQIFEWHPAGSNRPTNTPHVISFNGITQTVAVNQTVNGGKWNFLGNFNLSAGTNTSVRITDTITETNKSLMADAIRFLYLPSQSVNDVIVDNTNAVFVGSWSPTSSAADKMGSDYRFRSKGTGANTATYTPSLTVSGNYQVYEWHPAGSNRGTNVPHVITFSGGAQTKLINQQINGGKWNLLGTFAFSAGAGGNVKITDGLTIPTNGVVMADAIRFSFVAPAGPPNAPSAVAATTVSSTQINVTWQDNSTNEVNFIVVRGPSSDGPFTDVATLAANTTSYSSTGLSPDTTYFFGVRAVNSGGSSAIADGANATTHPLPPVAPSDLTAIGISSSEIDLAWTDNNGHATMFIVSRSDSSGGSYTDIATVPSQSTSYRDSGLQASTPYYYRVRSSNAGGDSANSNTTSATTLSDAPTATSNLQASAASSSQIDLSWTDNSSNENNFVVARSTSAGGPFTTIATVSADTTSYSDSGLSAHTTYYYQVSAVNAGGSSSSESVSAQTQNNAPSADAGAAQSVSADNNCEATVTLDGSASSDVDGDTLSFSWSGSFGTVSGATPAISLGLGTHTITLTVSDGFGGESSATVVITVNDTTAPVVTLDGTGTMTVECHGAEGFSDPGVSAFDTCAGDLSSSIVVSGAVDSNALGVYVLTYTVTDPSGNSSSATRTVNVVDTTAPQLALNGANPMTVECHSVFADPGATASDACDPNVSVVATGTVNVNAPGTYTVSYTATDASGNATTATRTVNIIDTTAPVLTLNGDATITVEAATTFADPGATATDVCAGDVTALIQVSGSVNTSVVGSYTLTYTVADSSGNSASITRTVVVVDTTAPVFTSVNSSRTVINSVNHKMVPITITATATDTVDQAVDIRIVSIESNEPQNGLGDGDTGHDWEITGRMTCNLRAERSGTGNGRVYTITVQATDNEGNTSLTTVTVTVPHNGVASNN